jgi:hypothetical protein
VQQLKLFRKFGKPFFDFIDSKIIEALNDGTLKYGAKSVRVGTTDIEGYLISIVNDNVTIIHEPPADVEEDEPDTIESLFEEDDYIDDGPDDEDDP